MSGAAFSLADKAGSGAARELARIASLKCSESSDPRAGIVCSGRTSLIGFRDDVIHLEYLDEYFKEASSVLILSRHSSSSGIPSFTVHYTGNPGGSAPYGGRPWSLARCDPRLGSTILLRIEEEASRSGLGSVFSVTYEATHHGPTENSTAVIFVEIGSTEREWSLEEAHSLVARAVVKALEDPIQCSSVGIGLGGNHYPAKFTRLALEERICFGHMIPRHVLRGVGVERIRDIVAQAVEKSGRVDAIYVEEKAAQAGKISVVKSFARDNGIDLVEL